MPIVKSFMLAAASNRKLQAVSANTANVDITHPQLPLTPNFAVPPNFGKALVCTVHSTWKGEAEAIRGEPYSRLNANEKFLVSFNWFLRFFEEGMLASGSKNHRGQPFHQVGTHELLQDSRKQDTGYPQRRRHQKVPACRSTNAKSRWSLGLTPTT